MLDLRMTGTITAESDISVSPPDHSRKEGRTTIMTLPEKSVWDGGELVTTVYVPGSSVRGRCETMQAGPSPRLGRRASPA